MKFEPHEYQTYCIDYIKSHPVAALLLDMGLGKTVITLTAIRDLMLGTGDGPDQDDSISNRTGSDREKPGATGPDVADQSAGNSEKIRKVLVVAPLRVARNTWPSEIRKWDHLQELTYSVIVGDLKTRKAAVEAQAMIYIINRENIRWLAEYYRTKQWTFDFDMIVLDELSSFKNYKSQRFRYMRQMRPYAKRIVGLTGTPTSNGLMDLWAEIGILDQGARFGQYITRFRERYFVPDKVDARRNIVYSYTPVPGAEDEIYDRISDITISMKAQDYLKMPECVSTMYSVYMDEDEFDTYEMVRKEFVLPFVKDGDLDIKNTGVLAGKLLQMANGAVYVKDGTAVQIHDQKLDALEDLLESANGQNVLIAYWFQHDRSRIMQRLRDVGYSPREIRTEQDIRDWNSGRIQVALIHPASAGHGLNLQAGGHILIWYGLTWSLELYQQTNARLWRQGQEKVVTIIHIVCRDTIDEDVIEALHSKSMTQERLIAAVKARLN